MKASKKVIFITGPTSSGKSSFVHRLIDNHFMNASVLSVDSVQVYQHLNIGSAKPTVHEIEKYNYEMINIVSPLTDFNAKDFINMLPSIIENMNEPIFAVGGTGLYIDAIKHGIFDEESDNGEARNALTEKLAKEGLSSLYDELCTVDPESASSIDRFNSRRVVRALEVYYKTGIKFSDIKKMRKKTVEIDYIEYSIMPNRETLYNNIDAKVISMFDTGLLNEVRTLAEMGVTPEHSSMQAIGYKECYEYLFNNNTNITKDDLISSIQKRTRQYAKRQLTWFKKYSNNSINIEDDDDNSIVDIIHSFMKNK